MTTQQQTEAVSAVWFVHAESGKPLGRLYISEGCITTPAIGAPIPDNTNWQNSRITAVRELAPTCAMRRFRITIRSGTPDQPTHTQN